MRYFTEIIQYLNTLKSVASDETVLPCDTVFLNQKLRGKIRADR